MADQPSGVPSLAMTTTRADLLLVADLIDALIEDGEDAPSPTAWSRRWSHVPDPDRAAQVLTQAAAGFLAGLGAMRGLTPVEAAADYRASVEADPGPR